MLMLQITMMKIDNRRQKRSLASDYFRVPKIHPNGGWSVHPAQVRIAAKADIQNNQKKGDKS